MTQEKKQSHGRVKMCKELSRLLKNPMRDPERLKLFLRKYYEKLMKLREGNHKTEESIPQFDDDSPIHGP